MSDLVAAYALLRLEELRADVRAELEQATTWAVRALSPPTLAVQVGPHQVDVPRAHAVLARIDVVVVAFVDGYVRPQVLPGAPGVVPVPPAVQLCLGIPLAAINVHAATGMIGQHNITRFDTPATG